MLNRSYPTRYSVYFNININSRRFIPLRHTFWRIDDQSRHVVSTCVSSGRGRGGAGEGRLQKNASFRHSKDKFFSRKNPPYSILQTALKKKKQRPNKQSSGVQAGTHSLQGGYIYIRPYDLQSIQSKKHNWHYIRS